MPSRSFRLREASWISGSGMPSPPVVTHERLGVWARQLRYRLAGPPRLVESRSSADLDRAIRGVSVPVVLIDLGPRPRAMLDDLDLAVRVAPGGLFLVLDPAARPGVALLAREIGATLVLTGVVPPPEVADLLDRWLAIGRRRAEADGWSLPTPPEPEPWDLAASVA